jgi:hypothetical protein
VLCAITRGVSFEAAIDEAVHEIRVLEHNREVVRERLARVIAAGEEQAQ